VSGLDPLGPELRAELIRLGPAGAIGEVADAWPEAVGEAIAANAWPARIARDGTLHVATSSSTWAFELTQLEATVRTRLAARLGPSAPPALRFAPGRPARRSPRRSRIRVCERPSRGPLQPRSRPRRDPLPTVRSDTLRTR
jgi:predicted nucleic acid-binding Zn ribbon protein